MRGKASYGRILSVKCCQLTCLGLAIGLSAVGIAEKAKDSSPMTRRWTTLDGLHENVVTALSRSSDGYLWVTTPLGVARFDGVKFTTYLPPDLPEVPPPATNAVALPRLPGRKVLCALAESNGVVWVGTDGDGLLRLRPRLVSLRHEAPATNGVVRFTDSTGRVWSGTSADGIRVVLRDGTERHFGTQDGFDARQVTSFAETPDGSVWVGSDGAGLWRVTGDKISRHPCHDGKGNDFVRALFCDSEGSLWVGARGEAITCLQDGNPTTVVLRKLAGVESMSFYEEPKGRLWLATDRSLLSFTLKEFKRKAARIGSSIRVETLGREDGYWFSPNTSLQVSRTAYAELLSQPPPRIVWETPKPTKPFPPDTETVSISYTADSPGMADRVVFSHRLLPRREKWNFVRRSRTANFYNLPPGDYRLEVVARLPFGDLSPPAIFEFSIAPHFYETTAFIVGASVFLLLAIFLVVRAVYLRRVRAKLLAARQRDVLAAERARIAHDIHDDVGARLTRVSYITEMATEKDPSIGEVADEVRDVIRALDEVVWAVEPRNDTLSAFADYLYTYAERYLNTMHVRLRASIPSELPAASVTSRTRHAVFMCVKEALNNIVKHAAATTAFVSLSIHGNEVRVTAGDDGKGFAGPREGGNGLANMRERMADIGGTFAVGPREGGGCEVVLSFKLNGKP